MGRTDELASLIHDGVRELCVDDIAVIGVVLDRSLPEPHAITHNAEQIREKRIRRGEESILERLERKTGIAELGGIQRIDPLREAEVSDRVERSRLDHEAGLKA